MHTQFLQLEDCKRSKHITVKFEPKSWNFTITICLWLGREIIKSYLFRERCSNYETLSFFLNLRTKVA